MYCKRAKRSIVKTCSMNGNLCPSGSRKLSKKPPKNSIEKDLEIVRLNSIRVQNSRKRKCTINIDRTQGSANSPTLDHRIIFVKKMLQKTISIAFPGKSSRSSI